MKNSFVDTRNESQESPLWRIHRARGKHTVNKRSMEIWENSGRRNNEEDEVTWSVRAGDAITLREMAHKSSKDRGKAGEDWRPRVGEEESI